MGNRVCFQYMRFTELNSHGNPEERHDTTYGYMIFDDYAEKTRKGWDTFEELQDWVSLGNVIAAIEEADYYEPESCLAEEIKERGMYFNGIYYSAEQLLALQKPRRNEDDQEDECNSLTYTSETSNQTTEIS